VTKIMVEPTEGTVVEQMAGYRQVNISPAAWQVLLQAAEVGLEGAGEAGVSDEATLEEAWQAVQTLQRGT
jgi:hypothetical protein